MNENAHGASTHEADSQRLVVGDPIRDYPRLAAREYPLGLPDQGALDAAAGHRPLDSPLIVDQHLCPWVERRRADPFDQRRGDDPPALAKPVGRDPL